MFTAHQEQTAENDISEDLQLIVSAIGNSRLDFEAVYLVGSFGRGEGSVLFDGSRWRAVNDFDLLGISSRAFSDLSPLKKLGRELAKSLHIDFVDIGCLPRATLPALPPTLENYDLKYASTLLVGPDLLEEIPDFDSRDIPAYEFARLLCNRTAGLLSTRLPGRLESMQYRINQFAKACIAVGDIAVYLGHFYNPSYRERLRRFESLSRDERVEFSLPQSAVDYVISGYLAKLGEIPAAGFTIDEALMQRMLESSFCAIATRCVERPINSLYEARRALANKYGDGSSLTNHIDSLLYGWLNREARRSPEMIRRILFSLPSFYIGSSDGTLKQGSEYLRRFWCIPGALRKSWDARSALMLWEEYCH
jgi:hypothetical protein